MSDEKPAPAALDEKPSPPMIQFIGGPLDGRRIVDIGVGRYQAAAIDVGVVTYRTERFLTSEGKSIRIFVDNRMTLADALEHLLTKARR